MRPVRVGLNGSPKHAFSTCRKRTFRKLPEPPEGFRVVKAIVCFRHGDRSASYNLFEPDADAAIREALGWALELPSRKETKQLEKYAPKLRSQFSQRPRDSGLGVFGKLTARGIRQTSLLGQWLAQQYVPSGNFSIPNHEAVTCFSSNYSRTISSAQSVLKELLGPSVVDGNLVRVKVSSPTEEFINVYPFLPRLQKLMYDAAVDPNGDIAVSDKSMRQVQLELVQMLPSFAFNIRRFSWLNYQDHFHCRAGRSNVPASIVRAKVTTKLHEYLGEHMVAETTNEDVKRLVRRLSDYITDEDAEMIFNSIDQDSNGKISFEEMLRFSETGFPSLQPMDLEKRMWEISECVESHVFNRFEAWYNSRTILNLAIGRLVRKIYSEMTDNRKARPIVMNASSTAPRITLVSGHDITIFPLLQSIGAWRDRPKVWPRYASTVIFEVLQKKGGPDRCIRAFYFHGFKDDGEPDIKMDELVFGDISGTHPFGEPKKLLPLSDFKEFAESFSAE
jgi:hypothetical protein|eukprot:Stramenopile-MAST_4_protein_2942